MIDWLKPILGDGYNEEIDNKIAAEINKGFVAKADYDAAKDAQRTAAEALADANKALAEYKDTDIDGLRKASSGSSRFPSAASTRPSSSFPARPGRKPAVTRRQPARPTSTSPSSRRMRSSSTRSTPPRRSSPRRTTRTRMPMSSAIALGSCACGCRG